MNVLLDAWRYLADGANWSGSGGMAALLLEQLLLTFTALLFAVAIGLPVALWLGHLGRGGFLAINISNVGRAVPTFALLALLVTFDWPGTGTFGPYGRAGLATLIALTAFALPPVITNAYIAVREVPAELVEAADGMGCVVGSGSSGSSCRWPCRWWRRGCGWPWSRCGPPPPSLRWSPGRGWAG